MRYLVSACNRTWSHFVTPLSGLPYVKLGVGQTARRRMRQYATEQHHSSIPSLLHCLTSNCTSHLLQFIAHYSKHQQRRLHKLRTKDVGKCYRGCVHTHEVRPRSLIGRSKSNMGVNSEYHCQTARCQSITLGPTNRESRYRANGSRCVITRALPNRSLRT